jgi:hypothetical protein
MIIPEPIIDDDIDSSADYSTDIHRHLDHLQKTLIKTIGRPISEYIVDNRAIFQTKQNEEF